MKAAVYFSSTVGTNFLGGSGALPQKILTVFYVYYNHSFPKNLNHWLLEKSDMINSKKIHSMF